MKPPDRALVVAFDRNYLWPGLVAGATGLAHSPEDVVLYVLGVDLDAGDRDLVSEVLPADRFEIVDAGRFADGRPAWQHISRAAWARVGIGSLLPVSVTRVVYLDADTMTRGSLAPLFELDLEGAIVAAANESPMPTHWDRHLVGLAEDPESSYADDTRAPLTYCYFNTGVLVVDMKAWMAEQVEERVAEMAADLPPSFIFLDQDALNSILYDDWVLLDWRKWNWPGYLKSDEAWGAHVAHFIAPPKPWVSSPLGAPFNLEYLRAARSLGWKLRPRRERVKSGLIETFLPNSIVLRRKRIARRLRR